METQRHEADARVDELGEGVVVMVVEESGKELAVLSGPRRWSCPHLPPSHMQARAGTAEAAVANDMVPAHG